MKTLILMVIAFSFLTAGCDSKKSENQTTAAGKPREVNLAIWGNYLAKESEEKFQKQTGIKLNITNYSSNEELLAKVQSGASGFDVAVPSDYMVEIMAKSSLLEPLDSTKIPNKSLIDEAWLKQSFDSENKYSLPYAWSTAGIAINREIFKGTIKSWKDVFENKELKGKLSLLDDVREVTAAALKMHGYSVNTVNKGELDKAKKTLLEVKSRVKLFSSDTIDNLVNKEVAVAQTYSPDALQAQKRTNGKIEYIIPTDGATRAIDNLVVVKGAKNLTEAHELINYFLSQESNLVFVKNLMVGPVLKGTKALLPADVQSNAGLFPPAETMSRLEKIQDLGDQTQLYDDLWTQIKTSK
jgi:spermidine/putrescine transport system substrate-binding protein